MTEPLRTRKSWDDFDGLAELYDSRPSYPIETVSEINRLLASYPASGLVVELGCGTGIFTRLLASKLQPSQRVLGIEPNADMRRHAVVITPPSLDVEYCDGTAEELPFQDASVRLLAAAGAAQRFDRRRFYPEAGRVLASGGLLALIHNKPRYQDSKFFSCFLELQERYVHDYSRSLHSDPCGSYSTIDLAAELTKVSLFGSVSRQVWHWDEYVTKEPLLQYTASSTVVAKAIRRVGRESFLSQVADLFDEHANSQERVHMPYVTEGVFAFRNLA